jgi:hypothetical protein
MSLLKGLGAGLDAAKAAASMIADSDSFNAIKDATKTVASKVSDKASVIADSDSFNAIKDATKTAASKVSDKVSQSEIYQLATHDGMSKEDVHKLHITKKNLHSKIMSDFLSTGNVQEYPKAEEHVNKLMLGLGILNIAGKVTGLDKINMALTAAKTVVTGQVVKEFIGDLVNSGVLDLLKSLQTKDDPDWLIRNLTSFEEPAVLLAMILLIVRDSQYDPAFHPASTGPTEAGVPQIFPEIHQFALLAQAAYKKDESEFQEYLHSIFPGYHMLVSLPDHKKGDAIGLVVENHPAFRLLVNPAAKTVILLVRGTATPIDAETDSKANAVAFPFGGPVPAGSQQFAHQGMLLAAIQVLKSEMHPCMEWLNAMAEKGFKVRLCGHSLGAGTASMMSFLLRDSEFNPTKCKLYESSGSLQVYAYSIPSIVSEAIAQSPISVSPTVPSATSPIFNVSLGDDAVPRMNNRNGLALMLQLKALMGNYDVVKTNDTTQRPKWLTGMMGIYDQVKSNVQDSVKHFADYSNQNANAAKQFAEAQVNVIISSTYWLLHDFERTGYSLPTTNLSELSSAPNVLVSPGHVLYLSVKEGQPIRRHWITHRSGLESRQFFNTLRFSAQSGFDHTMDFIISALHEANAETPYTKFRNPAPPKLSEVFCKVRFAADHRGLKFGVSSSESELASHMHSLTEKNMRLVRCEACLSLVCSDLCVLKKPVPSFGIYRNVRVCALCYRSGCEVSTWQNPFGTNAVISTVSSALKSDVSYMIRDASGAGSCRERDIFLMFFDLHGIALLYDLLRLPLFAWSRS